MGWAEFYRRRDALDAVLAHLRHDPGGPIPPADTFADADEVLLALHHRWTLKLTGPLGLARAEADRDPGTDLVDAVTRAWWTTASAFPVLRAVLDAHRDDPALRPGVEAEQRMLALVANLADPTGPRAEVTRVGAAFAALIGSTAPRLAIA
ncbi:hypothetical protein CLV40_104457 [Actinokineospora auranticolor]|uniref:TetR family transcriptional regulator n=2 Tax=Actinokineospora auranticolor TaxID=155976 RepID=A0A2S6GVH2_9PSEU|nr:hypothetical protein CLV40_104457 [Actinokineospora auranticolor]